MAAPILAADFRWGRASAITVRTGKRRIAAASLTGTYVVCLDCGKELAYDWQAMKIISVAENKHAVHALATKEAA